MTNEQVFNAFKEKGIEVTLYETPYHTVENVVIDTYEHDKQIRAEVIDNLNDSIHEIYKCQFYCMADMCEHDSPTVDMCIDCFYDAIQKRLEQLKEQR